MWKTRNIRRRNKGKKTKRQDGGLLPFMGPSMDEIINFAIKNEMEVTAQFEKKNGVFSKVAIISFKVKLMKGKQIKFIQDEESKFDEINANLKPDTPYKYEIKGSKLEVMLSIKNGTKIMIAISETSMKDIKDKIKMEKETDLQKIKEINQKTEDRKVQQKKEEKFTFKAVQINSYFKRNETGTQPYSSDKLNYLYYCIETYLPDNALTKDAVHKFVEEFDKPLTESPKTKMDKNTAMIRLKSGIDQFNFNKSKTELQKIVKILSVDPDQLDNYLTPNQSLSKKCSAITIGDRSKEDLIKYNSEICFIVESLKPYAEDDLILLDIEKSDDRNKMSIADFVENGARLEETWKLKEFKPHYEYFGYVSKGEDADSLVGFMCYDKQSNPNILKVSNIIWADNDNGKTQDLRNKLYDILENELTGKSLQSKLFIPAELDEKVNATLYTKGETKDGFTIWEAIMPPKPTEMEIKIKAETDPKAVTFLEFLQKLLLLFKEKVKKMVEPATDIKPTVLPDDIQAGGADNALLDEIITKYPSLKGLKSMIDNLPEDIQQKYASDITKTLEEVKKSNVEETDLMDEPEFQEIQADLNAQIVEKEEKAIEEEKEKATEETPTDTPSTESKEGETPTDTVEPQTDTPSTDTVESTTESKEGEPTTVETDTTATNPSTETTVETPTTTDTNTSVETTVVTPTTDATAGTEPSTTTVEEPSVATVVTPTTETTVVTPATVEPTTTNVVTPTVVEPTTTNVVTPTAVEPTTGTEPSNTDVTTTTPSSSDEVTLKREDLKESPLLVQPATGESGKYIFVPKDLVEKVIDYLLNNGCEVTTVNLK